MNAQPTVFVVDDDDAVRDGIALLCETAGLAVESFASGEAFLDAYRTRQPGCLVLDVRMAGMGGPELQAELVRRGIRLPIIFLTAYVDIPIAVQAIKAGAVEFLTKPVEGSALIEHIQAAIAQSCRSQESEAANRGLRERLASLTGREREVMALAMAGQSNKEIARRLGISHRTVEIHRARAMHKTAAANLLDFARMAEVFGLDNEVEKAR